MIKRCLETIENVAVDAGGLAYNFEPGLLAKLSGHIANQSRESADAVGQRSHPAGQNLVVQSARECFALAGKILDCFDCLSQLLQALGGLGFGLGQSFAIGCGSRVFSIRDAVFQKLEAIQAVPFVFP